MLRLTCEDERNSSGQGRLTEFTARTAENWSETGLVLHAPGSYPKMKGFHDLRTDEDISRGRAFRKLHACGRTTGPYAIGGQRFHQEARGKIRRLVIRPLGTSAHADRRGPGSAERGGAHSARCRSDDSAHRKPAADRPILARCLHRK